MLRLRLFRTFGVIGITGAEAEGATVLEEFLTFLEDFLPSSRKPDKEAFEVFELNDLSFLRMILLDGVTAFASVFFGLGLEMENRDLYSREHRRTGDDALISSEERLVVDAVVRVSTV
jgi:hypothetical protein